MANAASDSAAAEEPPPDLSLLPSVESIDSLTDISGFLQKGIPESLRNAALQKIWSADPAIRDYIGPADWAWDWNTPGGMPGYEEVLNTSASTLKDLLARAMGEFSAPPKEEVLEGGAQSAAEIAVKADDAAATKARDAADVTNDVATDHPAQISSQQSTLSENSLSPTNTIALSHIYHAPEPEPTKTTANSEHLQAPQRRRHGSALPL
jgi:hypothetical protein